MSLTFVSKRANIRNFGLHRCISVSFRSFAAWKELDIDVCAKQLPLNRPASPNPDPEYTMKQGQEIYFSRSVAQLQTDLEELSNTYYSQPKRRSGSMENRSNKE